MLWATDAEFLNDAQELRFGRTELQRALSERSAEVKVCDPSDGLSWSTSTIMESAADALTKMSRGPVLGDPWHAVYVSCFCEQGDLLSQWRGYKASGGFAIGFSRPALGELSPIQRESPAMLDSAESAAAGARLLRRLGGGPGYPIPVSLAPVQYGPSAVRSMIAQVLQDITPQRAVGHPGVTGYYQVQNLILPALAKVKDDAFLEEREWRLIIVGPPAEVYFRPGSLGVIPYTQVPFDLTTIEEVIIGPGPHMELRERGLARLLAVVGVVGVTITRSRAPFRG